MSPNKDTEESVGNTWLAMPMLDEVLGQFIALLLNPQRGKKLLTA